MANLLVVIVGIVVISLSLALGFVVFIAIASVMLIMAAIVSVRVWWLKRRLGRGANLNETEPRNSPGSSRVIEGEFREVGRSRKESRDE